MNILGLHFGHDASVAVIRDGELLVNLYRERHNRVKHACSLDVALVDKALAEAGMTFKEIDFCAVTSTQNYELIVDNHEEFSVSYEQHARHTAPCSLRDIVTQQNTDMKNMMRESLLNAVYREENPSQYHRNLFPEYQQHKKSDFHYVPYLAEYVHLPGLWDKQSTLEELATSDFSQMKGNDTTRFGLHYPVTVKLHGCTIPGYIMQHHAAHAASCYYLAGVDGAAILTHDGAFFRFGHNNGMFYYGDGHRIYPITPHHLAIGDFYDQVGGALGFDLFGAAGKLMGLAPYGKPRFFDRRFVGNSVNFIRNGIKEPFPAWKDHCLSMARMLGYDFSSLGKLNNITAQINADIAASTQKVFEETFLLAVEALRKIMTNLQIPTKNLCFAGGTALNCPSNARVYREGSFENVFIEPNCDDSGLALGAAFYLYHNVLDYPLVEGHNATQQVKPYYGCSYAENDVVKALDAFVAEGKVVYTSVKNAAESAAADLADNKIIAWFEGRSESGPRALGHRSILADPRKKENWARVNRVKSREEWRPFAPSVLESEAHKWFVGGPLPSSYMLFTAFVCSQEVPAITHVDGSARVQTVNEQCGDFYHVLRAFHQLTAVPMVLNTSFNGPGEPIVERPEEALAFLATTDLDVLYLGGYRVSKCA